MARTASVAGRAAGTILRNKARRRPTPGRAPLAPVADAFQELGATYVKIGQLIGSAPGMFGPEFADAFRGLLDTGPPVPGPDVRAAIEADLGRPLRTLFATFEEQPLAAASIAVVHRATLPTGERVAVKVLRPGIEEVVASDVALLAPVIRFLARQGVEMAFPLQQFFAGLRQQVAEELDLRHEASAMVRFKALFEEKKLDLIVVPTVHPSRSGARTLTMELLDGVPIDDPAVLRRPGADPRALLLQLLKAWYTTAVVDGVFHGDLHAGNVLLLSDGRLGVIDWGILGRLDPKTHWLFRRMLEACLGDASGWRDVAEVYREVGVSMQDDFGLSTDVAATLARAQIEPIMTRPLGRVDLQKLIVTSRDVTTAAGSGAGPESVRERVRRIRTLRRYARRVIDAGLRDGEFDRANFMLGKQLMYIERFGKMYLQDDALLHDRRFLSKLLATPGPPSPLRIAPTALTPGR